MFYLATYRWQDGEQQYYTRRFIKSATCQAEADQLAEGFLTDMWGEETINEDGDYRPPCGYPIVRVDSCRRVSGLFDVIRAIGTVEQTEIYVSEN